MGLVQSIFQLCISYCKYWKPTNGWSGTLRLVFCLNVLLQSCCLYFPLVTILSILSETVTTGYSRNSERFLFFPSYCFKNVHLYNWHIKDDIIFEKHSNSFYICWNIWRIIQEIPKNAEIYLQSTATKNLGANTFL